MDILSHLESDHRRFLFLAERLLRMISDGKTEIPGEALDILRRLRAGFSLHKEIEGRLLHPLLLTNSAGCWHSLQEATRENRDIEHALNGIINELGLESPKPDTRRGFQELDRCLRRHLFHEENDAFYRAKQDVPAEELTRLGEEADRLCVA